MKNTLLPTFAILTLQLLTVCCSSSPQDDKAAAQTDSVSAETIKSSQAENTYMNAPSEALWEYQFDTVINDFRLVKLRDTDQETLTIGQVVNIVNKTWPKVKVEYLRTSADTVFIAIPYSEVLTQQMGSSGAEAFMISTTYSITELKGIQYVSYEFDVGDHANPGLYSRDTWKSVLK